MKKIELKRLELTNYRNIEYAVYDFDGSSQIIGENRIGKTNTLESIYWLLSDKLLDGSSELSAIKPLKDTKLEVKVKATFDIDGKIVTLEKRYKENWVKTRGTTDLEMKGHVITWIHNDVKQSTLKAYNQLVCEDFGFTQDNTTKVDFIQMLINPFYLGNIGEGKDWTELRAFIIKLIGDVSDADVVRARPELSIIQKDLEKVGGRVDQLKKKHSADIETIKNQIISDEGQIELLEQTHNPTDDEVAIAKKGIEEHTDKIAALKANNGLDIASMEIGNKITDKKLELSKLEKEDLLKAQSQSGTSEIRQRISDLQKQHLEHLDKKTNLRIKVSSLQREINVKEKDLETSRNKRVLLIERLKEIDTQISNPSISETECPHCHRPYDAEKLEGIKASIVNNLKATKEQLINEGKEVRIKIDNLENEISTLKVEIAEHEEKINEVETQLKTISEQITELEQKSVSVVLTIVENPQIAILKDEIAKLQEEQRVSRDNYFKGIQDNQQLIYDEEQAMTPFKKVLSDREYYLRQMHQLEFIRANHTFHSNELANVEQKKELLNNFIYTKLKMLDDNVSRVFGNIKFQLIKENINGGFDAICKPYIYDTISNESTTTSWKSGSKSERVVTGIAIVEAIKNKLGLPNLPYLFDEGGEVSSDTLRNRIITDSQLICVKIADNIMSPLVQKI